MDDYHHSGGSYMDDWHSGGSGSYDDHSGSYGMDDWMRHDDYSSGGSGSYGMDDWMHHDDYTSGSGSYFYDDDWSVAKDAENAALRQQVAQLKHELVALKTAARGNLRGTAAH